MTLKDKLFSRLLNAYPYVISNQADNGQFFQGKRGYSVYCQYSGYYFACLYTLDRADNPYFRDPDTLDRAIRGWDFYYTQTTEEGLTIVYTNNKYWGTGCDEWGAYHWMNTIELLGDSLPQAKSVLWNRRLGEIAVQMRMEIAKSIDAENAAAALAKNTRNHLVWTVLCYFRYGMLYNDGAAMEYAAKAMDLILSVQLPCGIWLEGGAPVVGYGEITLSAISLYEHFSKCGRADAAMEKGLRYMFDMMYPDFTGIECIDGRQRHKKETGLGNFPPTFLKDEKGMAYLSGKMSRLEQEKDFDVESLTGLPMIAHITAVMPDSVIFNEGDADKLWASVAEYPDIKARILRKDEWVIPFCCLEQATLDNRWDLHRQNLFSVFHKKTGLLLGGGHSIAQPQFSCFNVISGGKMHYLHTSGSILPDVHGMSLLYGDKKCRVEFKEISPSKVSVEYAVEGLCDVERVYVNIPLVGEVGNVLYVKGQELAWQKEYFAVEVDAGIPVVYKSAELTLDQPGVLQYPVFPYNPYVREQTKDFKEVFAILTVELDYKKPACSFTLGVNGQEAAE